MKKQTKKQTKKSKEEDYSIKQLQFECEDCKLKIYINLEDETLLKFPKTIKCISCGKKQATKRRIFKMIITHFKDYDDSVCPNCDRIYEEVKE